MAKGVSPEFTHPRLILTEGIEDTAFLRALIEYRNIRPFNIYPNFDICGQVGNSAFKKSAIGCVALTGFSNVEDILIVADNDDNPQASFDNICSQIEGARTEGPLTRNWGVMSAVGIKANGDPSITSWLWPENGKPGCLETLIWQVLEKNHAKEAACVNNALTCSGADNWSVSKRDKAKVRCFFSLKCKKNPTVNLSLIWRDCPEIIALNDQLFDPISNFLSVF